ncbi:hypothetical protein DFS34DRAFT_348313, partial [Phlyctochytrium arcticum]
MRQDISTMKRNSYYLILWQTLTRFHRTCLKNRIHIHQHQHHSLQPSQNFNKCPNPTPYKTLKIHTLRQHELKKKERFQKERESLVETMRNVVKSFKMDGHYESQENFKRFFFLNLSTHTKSRGTNKKITKESVWRLYETVMETDGFVQVHQYFCKECDNFWKRGCCDKYKKSTRGNRLWIVKNA